MGCHNSRLVGYAIPISEPRPIVVNTFNTLPQCAPLCPQAIVPLGRPCLGGLPLAGGIGGLGGLGGFNGFNTLF